MAFGGSGNADSVLRGLWGSLVNAAQSGRDAANMWSGLRSGAYDYAAGVLNVTSAEPPSEAQIQAAANSLISNVTVTDMNRYVQLAGQFLTAKQNLFNAAPYAQIEGSMIFDPPWATTSGNPAVPTRYRIRVLRTLTVHGFTTNIRNEWATYELAGPLTSIQDALNYANTLFNQADYNKTADIFSVNDYTLETV
jgi:hypothetical protein